MTLSNMIKSNIRKYGHKMTFLLEDDTCRTQFAMIWRPGQKSFTSLVKSFSEEGWEDIDLFYLLCPPFEGERKLKKACTVTDHGKSYQVIHIEPRFVGCEIYFLFAVLRRIYAQEDRE